MEYQEFCKIQKRMCKSQPIYCDGCPISNLIDDNQSCYEWMIKNPNEAKETIEKWAKENPPMTNGDKLQTVFGIDISWLHLYNPLHPNYGISINGIRLGDWLKQEYVPLKGV